MAKAKSQEESVIIIPSIEIVEFQVRIIGESPLISHAWSKKAKQEMLDKQMGKAKKTKNFKNPWIDFCESLYWLTGMPEEPTEEDIQKASFGFPTTAFKEAAISGGYRSKVLKDKVSAYSAFHILGEFAVIEGIPQIREDMVRIANGSADIRYRGEFKEWSTVITIRHNKNALSAEQIVNLFNLGGFGVGVGEWRIEKGGTFGSFKVA